MSLIKEDLKEIEERLNNTQLYKDGGNNLVIGIDNGEFQFTKDGDAEFLTSLAKQYILKKYLSARQIIYARKKIMKYAGQLVKIANGVI